MRLLHTDKLSFEEFFDSNIPPYAILSHRWEEDEVSFQEFKENEKKEGAGFSKILNCCALARSHGHDWVWIDTCCIDKKSSAELSEAINSMFQWYENAEICYAYLSDAQYRSVGKRRVVLGFEQSKWFTRGWTLQELLAPSQVLFLDQRWEAIGTKNGNTEIENKKNLSPTVSKVTGIPVTILDKGIFDFLGRTSFSVAQRMSWASGRETSRTEDMAYCLLGIFNVNMPLLYGEGDKAFLRLQQEIIKMSADESIFAWSLSQKRQFHHSSLFAASPSCFARSGHVKRRSEYTSWIQHSSYVLTDAGVQMDALLISPSERHGNIWLLPLNCETNEQRNAMVLQLLDVKKFRRLCSSDLDFIDQAILECSLTEMSKRETLIKRPPPMREKLLNLIKSEGLSESQEQECAEEKPVAGFDPVSTINIESRPGIVSRPDTLPDEYRITCNKCQVYIPNEHYHCSVCDAGDFHLCQSCFDRGVTCDSKDHWLIKRYIKGDQIISSINETIAFKKHTGGPPCTPRIKRSAPLRKDTDKSVGEQTCQSCMKGESNRTWSTSLKLTLS